MTTLAEISARLANAMGVPVEAVREQVRGLRDRGQIVGVRDHVSDDEIYVARVLIAARAAGVTSERMDALMSELRHGRTAVFPNTGSFEINLTANLARIRAGERWGVELTVSRDPIDGSQRFGATWFRDEVSGLRNRFNDRFADPNMPGAETGDGQPIEAVIILDVSALLRPLLVGDEG